jgi:hypothetical protein
MKTYKFKPDVSIDKEIEFDKVKKFKGAETRLQTHHGDKYIRLEKTNVMVPESLIEETEPDPPEPIGKG